MQLSDLATSLARTAASKIIGGLIGVALALGIALPADLSTQLTLTLTASLVVLAQYVYYVVARVLERRWPAVGKVLLLSGKQPGYGVDVPLHYRVVLDSDLMEQQIQQTSLQVERRIRQAAEARGIRRM